MVKWQRVKLDLDEACAQEAGDAIKSPAFTTLICLATSQPFIWRVKAWKILVVALVALKVELLQSVSLALLRLTPVPERAALPGLASSG